MAVRSISIQSIANERRSESYNGDFDLFSYDLYLYLKQATPEFEQLAAVEAGGNGFSVRQAAPRRGPCEVSMSPATTFLLSA
jgi:hypothetical protein